MSDAKDITLSLKIMTNKQQTKVLFAEADSDFVDVLLSFLTLPLGKIVKVLEIHYGDQAPAVGSLSNLYRSLANLDNARFVNEGAKLMLLNPRNSFAGVCPNLKFNVSEDQQTQYYTCDSKICLHEKVQNICMYYAAKCDCGGNFSRKLTVQKMRLQYYAENCSPKPSGGAGGFTLNTASFVISDDLRVVPYATGFLQTLRNVGVADINGAELKNVTFGIDEIIGLLRWSLISETPLTDLILNNRQKPSFDAKQSHLEIPLHRIEKKEDNSKNIIVKVTLQKSTNKLLFAQAEADFVELLFRFLTIPLGRVQSLLKNNTFLKNIDNLYMSLANVIDVKYFTTPKARNRLMNPKLAHCYTSENQFLPLSEESAPKFYYYNEKLYNKKYFSESVLVPFFKSPKVAGNYVKEPTTYMVTDDLTVTPFSTTAAVSILGHLNIPLGDVVELEVNIGLEEALRILNASLTLTSALSTALMSHLFKKQPKQEDLDDPSM